MATSTDDTITGTETWETLPAETVTVTGMDDSHYMYVVVKKDPNPRLDSQPCPIDEGQGAMSSESSSHALNSPGPQRSRGLAFYPASSFTSGATRRSS
eukprot:CAMPEP_0175849724 /NCGR_PEP_ID=MMETSP0107_2-20121207/24682_1 /TAXON_ID=195067 ORGANISM="Goniomonas pacifica, Strain CCMP1869" /NCGR_SAMPLE_ID=MMETSP0107_2 /ASSEMBLY_ACC=CAM_ASM_000203 /LENGTH=97 /DNA_ID=CAMNT_0017164911 /DNA_START=244 /DNA_END=534 /DNA_ORIENTATION=+